MLTAPISLDLALIERQTREYRDSLQESRFREWPLQQDLRGRLQQIKGKNLAEINVDASGLMHTLDWALRQPKIVDPELLAAYIMELIRLMENVGAGLDFRVAMDKAISYYEANDQPVIDLYLANVEYLRLTDTESKYKEDILKRARTSIRSAQDNLKVLLKLMQYYIDTSQYRQAIKTSETCQLLISELEELKAYLPKVYNLTGVTYYYHFDFVAATEYLWRAAELGNTTGDAHTTGEALHYLGRVAMDQGDAQKAMEYFISDWQRQPDNLADSAWYHLRMGNLLVNAGLVKQAKDHLTSAQELFRRIKYDGSALVQVELGWGDSSRADRDYAAADRHYRQALRYAKDTGFARGRLLSLVKRFWLELVCFRRLDKAVITFFLAMFSTEIWRNLGLRLVLLYLRQVLSMPVRRWMGRSFSVTGVAARFATPPETCLCPMHSSAPLENERKNVED